MNDSVDLCLTFTKAFFLLILCIYFGESTEKTPTKKSKTTKLPKAQLVHREDKTGALLSKPGFHDVCWMLWSGRDHSEKDLFLLPLNRFPRASAAARLRKSSGGGCGLALTPHFNSFHHIIPRDYPFSSLSPNISAFFPAVSRLQVSDPWCSAVVTSPGSATPGTHAVRSQPLGGAARAPQSAFAPRDCSSTVAYFMTV